MANSVRGTITHVLNMDMGQKKDGSGTWRKQGYVLKTEGQYSYSLKFDVLNDKIEQFNIQMGQTVEIDIEIKSREYNGRWYHDVTAWRCNNLGFVPQFAQQGVYQQTAPQGYAPSVTPTNQFGQPIQPAPATANNDISF